MTPKQTATAGLRKPCDSGYSRVKVAISLWPSAATPDLQSKIDPNCELRLEQGNQALVWKSEHELVIACELAAINGVEHFRRQYPKQIDYRVTLLEGDNLQNDCTVGFGVAAFLAAVRATGFTPAVEDDRCGWREEK